VARSLFSVKMVLYPTKCIVAAYWSRSAKTRASSTRECSSCEGFGSLAFMYTTKWVSAVNRDIWPFCIATVRAAGVGLDELPNGETVRSFLGGWQCVCSLGRSRRSISSSLAGTLRKNRPVFEKAFRAAGHS
jgi:hypothetical protein